MKLPVYPIALLMLLTAVPAGGSAAFIMVMLTDTVRHGWSKGPPMGLAAAAVALAVGFNLVHWFLNRYFVRTNRVVVLGYTRTFWRTLLGASWLSGFAAIMLVWIAWAPQL